MTTHTPSDLKKALIARGFDVYSTKGGVIALAERVRENLIMESGVAVSVLEPLQVRVSLRVQASRFPDESSDDLVSRARALGATLVAAGYAEESTAARAVADPSDPTRTLDTWYEVLLTRAVADIDMLEGELKRCLATDRSLAAD